ncbi:MAG: hypothetical protein AM326_11400 [Candidatus Thorarchaeota archaeon SMTZ-45]|nr:MAG: hypothetical protein AM326_11400 [Candidatus Thorarchaeota archaeon SMTZ-45]
MGKWSLRDYVETIKLSVHFTRTYYLSIFLAIIGVFVITIVLFLLIVLIGSIPLSIFYGPFDEVFDVFDFIGDALSGANDVEAVGIVLFAGSAILAPFLIAIGALFGIGQEAIEGGTVTAEEALLWYRQKFSRLASGGIVQFLIIIIPIGIEYILAAWYFRNQMPDNTILTFLVFIAALWFLLSSGMLSMVFPSIVDGIPVFSSIMHSIKLALKNSGAVFSVWSTFSSLGLLLLGPIIIQEFTDVTLLADRVYDFYILGSASVIFLLLLPVYVLSVSRTYLIISDPNIEAEQEIHTEGS